MSNHVGPFFVDKNRIQHKWMTCTISTMFDRLFLNTYLRNDLCIQKVHTYTAVWWYEIIRISRLIIILDELVKIIKIYFDV